MATRRVLAASLGAAILCLNSGCASIFNGRDRAIPVSSTPPGARVSIYDRDNQLVMTLTTPFSAKLRRHYGYFQAQTYRLEFELAGYQKAEIRLTSKISGWYFGNILFGGLIGMLAVDPNTGAMYNLAPEKVEHALSPQATQELRDGDTIGVVLVSQLTANERAALVRIN